MSKIYNGNKEQMKTNQVLTVELGYGFGRMDIGHKDHMTSGIEVINKCNQVIERDNEINGTHKRFLSLDHMLNNVKICKLVIEVHLRKKYGFINPDGEIEINDSRQSEVCFKDTNFIKEINGEKQQTNPSISALSDDKTSSVSPVSGMHISDTTTVYDKERKKLYKILEDNTDSSSKVNYTNLIKRTKLSCCYRKHKAKDGKFYKSVYIDLYILLEFAARASLNLKLAIYDSFVKNDLFLLRDTGGVEYKLMGQEIKNVFGNKYGNNKYLLIANTILQTVRPNDKDWNLATNDDLKRRLRLQTVVIALLKASEEDITLTEFIDLIKRVLPTM